MKQSEIVSLVIAVNLTTNFLEKYPFGNMELTLKLKKLEEENKIEYDKFLGKWKMKK